jgi:carboxyl-terminal processing protease
MSKKTLTILIVLFTAVNIIVGSFIYDSLADTPREEVIDYDLITSAVAAIQRNYVDPEVKTKDLIEGALEGMLGNLDTYSQYMDLKARENMKIETTGRFGGLGIHITKRKGFVTIIAPIDNTPAARVGLMPGDKIVGVDGEALKDPSTSDVVDKLRGEAGTKVSVTILRGVDTIKEFTLTRAIINVPSVVDPEIVEDNIGYVRLSQFQEKSAKDLEKTLDELRLQGMDSLILDLRRNPGGLLLSAVDVVDLFVPPNQIIVSTKGKVRAQNRVYYSRSNTPYMKMPMVVLIDHGSASASEIVAGALGDIDRAILVGVKSFGKGSVQTILPIDKSSALRLTTAKYYTPSDVSIHKVGIEPDIEVKLGMDERNRIISRKYREMEEKLKDGDEEPSEETGEIDPLDPQLRRAVDILKAVKVYRNSMPSQTSQ